MTLTQGARLGPYEIVSAIGAGGMGEVFRARDTKLNRDVAIKVLPGAIGAPLRVALLVGGSVDNVLEHVIALSGLRFGVHPEAVPTLPGLPRFSEGDAVLLGSQWAAKAAAAGVNLIDALIPRLRRNFNRVVGFDQEPSFRLGFPSDVMETLDSVIRPHGVYTDPGLYAWDVGALTAAGRWTERIVALPVAPTPAALSRVSLGAPFLLTECPNIRARLRTHRMRVGQLSAFGGYSRALMDFALAFAPTMRLQSPPRRTAQFLGALTHVQRIDAVRLMQKARVPCDAGITHSSVLINGLGGDGRATLEPAARSALEDDLRGEGLMVPRRSRLRYRMDMLSCKAVVSITGHGELCFRMAEAMWMKRILVTQDLSHVRTSFPFRPGVNVVYCRPDLSDLIDILDDIECNFGRYLPIAEEGHADFLAFASRADQILGATVAPLAGLPGDGLFRDPQHG